MFIAKTAVERKNMYVYTCINIYFIFSTALPYFVERRLRVDGVQRLNRNLSETVSFNCNAGGNPAPTIDWYKGGVRMNYRRQNVVINDYTMKVKDLRLSDAGTYICRLRNDMGSISFTYSLTVKGKYEQGL